MLKIGSFQGEAFLCQFLKQYVLHIFLELIGQLWIFSSGAYGS